MKVLEERLLFDKNKKYIFSAEKFRKNSKKTCTWPENHDGEEILVKGICTGNISGGLAVLPNWCIEVSNKN